MLPATWICWFKAEPEVNAISTFDSAVFFELFLGTKTNTLFIA